MRQAILAVLLVGAARPGPAAAQQATPLPIMPGQQITLQIDDTVSVIGVAHAEMTAFDTESAARLGNVPIPSGPVPEGSPYYAPPGTKLPVITPGQAKVRMFTVNGGATLLAIENGYDRAIRYRARMTVKGKTGPTDVCIVVSRKSGYEYWPFRIERLDLSDFALVPWQAGDPVPCA